MSRFNNWLWPKSRVCFQGFCVFAVCETLLGSALELSEKMVAQVKLLNAERSIFISSGFFCLWNTCSFSQSFKRGGKKIIMYLLCSWWQGFERCWSLLLSWCYCPLPCTGDGQQCWSVPCLGQLLLSPLSHWTDGQQLTCFHFKAEI